MSINVVTANDDYRVNLEIFEGPLDLLLYLIKKNDLDVYDIPIAFVLEEYMKYIDTLRVLDIDMAGEFLLMAADLAHIKSRMLLPHDEVQSEEEEIDPRADLVKRLLEYQQYRDAAERLERRSQLGRDVFTPLSPQRVESTGEGPLEADIYDLISAFGKMLKRVPLDRYHEIAVDRMSVNARILQLVELIQRDVSVTLQELVGEIQTRHLIVVTFLALLEMTRLKMVKVYQSEKHGHLYVRGVMEQVEQSEALQLVNADWDEERTDGTK